MVSTPQDLVEIKLVKTSEAILAALEKGRKDRHELTDELGQLQLQSINILNIRQRRRIFK